MSAAPCAPARVPMADRPAASTAARLGAAIASPVVSLATMIALWYVLIALANFNTLVTKNPFDVVQYLVTGADAAANRLVLGRQLVTTLRDASLGYVTGTIIATAVACLFVMFRGLEQTLMPVVMVLRTAPIVAMTPLITLLFGNGLPTVFVIGTIIVFFPSLVNVVFGLRSASPEAIDLMASYGASRWEVLRMVQLPSALPAFFASARIAVPSDIIGALVAEWLATGQGMGYQMLISSATFDYAGLWTSVVVLTVVSIVIYGFVGVIETLVLGRVMPTATSDEATA